MTAPFKPGDIIRYDSRGALRQFDGIIGVCIEVMSDSRVKVRPIFRPEDTVPPNNRDWYHFGKLDNITVLHAK